MYMYATNLHNYLQKAHISELMKANTILKT